MKLKKILLLLLSFTTISISSSIANANNKEVIETKEEMFISDNEKDIQKEKELPKEDKEKVKDEEEKISKVEKEETINTVKTNILKGKGGGGDKQQNNATQNSETIVEKTNVKQSEKQKVTDKDKTLESRQFLTLEAETGKEFVIVVDYYSDMSKEVKFLTELNEDDMKNLIQYQNGNSKFETTQPKTEEKKELPIKNTKIEEQPKIKKTDNKKEKSNFLTYLIAIGGFALVGGFVFFKGKNKK